MAKDSRPPHAQTVAVRHGQKRTPEREHNEAIFTTSSYVFDNAEQAGMLFSGQEQGNVYSRFTNPTVLGFESRLAELENASHCVAVSSGMAAIHGTLLALLKSGDHVVASSSLFGSTVSLLTNVFEKFGVQTSFVNLTDPKQWKLAIRPNTKLFFLETPSNPLCEIADIRQISRIAHDIDALLVVDNAFMTPILQRPIENGADIVVHTATKYLDGQGRCVGGAIVTNESSIHEKLFAMLRTTGPCMSPFNAWTFNKGLETLPIRMKHHCSNALAVARWLQTQSPVKRVHYPGLQSHPQHELAKQLFSGFGGIVSFEIEGGKYDAWTMIDSTEMLSITGNLGDVKTTITHPATTTHARISQEARDRARITDTLIRLSVGLEHIEDILDDLELGLNKVDVISKIST
ncbi:MAG: O-succinylhomoserine sulfhydrylase [Gammaproteobacteria bacterium]|nr:O-succinylhomoserine sulfhydrylase [Gammaproteobacteria bacterium]